ncbi:unnamed protein product [Mytilus coruscus]|uniref:SGNH hydrolase-type esterase domain-containing protein n=1 Tax=Mytilus coruscus TaxID=42192 RepID=A0A6J8CKF8_MYTCO|nr:unnamed protein product [Mytilus coruscus]
MEKSLKGKNLHVTLLGHSFIRRLNRFMDSCDKFDNLRFLKSNFLINCRAQGGLTVARLAQQKQLCTFSYHPHMIFLQIGGNDAANRRTNAYQIAQDIFAFAMYLHYGLNVNYVVIGQLLYRSESVTYAGYNDKIIQINTLLQEKIKENDENAISYWHHRGFLCFDGVHLNHFGMRKYFKSVRSAVKTILNWQLKSYGYSPGIPPSYNSTIIQADIHADTGTDHTRIIPTSPISQNIDPAVNTVPTPIPSFAASKVRFRASEIQENPPCTVAPEDSADQNPSYSTSKEFNIQTVVETLFSGEPPVNNNMSSENSLRIQVSDGIPLGATISQKI